MKRILLGILFMTLATYTAAQVPDVPRDSITGKIIYTDVVRVDSANADQLYTNAKVWVVESFKSAKEVVQMDDKAAHIIICKGTSRHYIKGVFGEAMEAGWLNFKIRIDCKDARYKYIITDFVIEGAHGTVPVEEYSGNRKQVIYLLEQVRDLSTGLIAGLVDTMKKAQTISTKNDW